MEDAKMRGFVKRLTPWVGMLSVLGCTPDVPGPNRAPIAVVVPGDSVEQGQEVRLDGSRSTDPDGDPITYAWTWRQVPGESTPPTLLNSDRAQARFTPEQAGWYQVSLRVGDGQLWSRPALVGVRVGLAEGCTRDEDCPDDGLLCNGSPTCVEGECQMGPPPCEDDDPCTQDLCQEEPFACDHPPVEDPPGQEGPPGDASCDDGLDNDCDGLTDGEDTGCAVCTEPADCEDQNPCTVDDCVDQLCSNEPIVDGTDCDDGSLCTEDDSCKSGICTGQSKDCSDLDAACTQGVCNESDGQCRAQPLPEGSYCEDGSFCTADDQCDGSGNCQPGPSPCREPCQTVCDENGLSCNPNPQGSSCDDGALCTLEDVCDGNGNCKPGHFDNTMCPEGQVCRPACFSSMDGCGVPPASLNLSCESDINLWQDTDLLCQLDSTGASESQQDCLFCEVQLPQRQLLVTDFELDDSPGTCDLDGWTLVTGQACFSVGTNCPMSGEGNLACCENFTCPVSGTRLDGRIAFQALKNLCANEQWRLDRQVNTVGLEDLELCFEWADVGAADEPLHIIVRDRLGQRDAIFCDRDGPLTGVDGQMTRSCAQLPDWAENHPAVQLSIYLHSNNAGDALILDNISLRGQQIACPASTEEIWSEPFTACDDPLQDMNDWTVSGALNCFNDFTCGGGARVIADNSSGSIQRRVSTAEHSDLELCFDYGDDNANADESLLIEVDPADNGNWQTIELLNGNAGTDRQCRRRCLDLSTRKPQLDFNPAWGLRFSLTANGAEIHLDNITLSGSRPCQDASLLQSGALSPLGAESYEFTVEATGDTPVQGQVICRWSQDSSSGNAQDNAQTVTHTWWDPTWTRRTQLLVDNSEGTAELTDFPILVRLNPKRINYADCQAAGADLRFVPDGQSASPLAHQIEYWDANGDSIVWVKAPPIPAGEQIRLWMYYGNPSVASNEAPEQVWDTGFEAVWHLGENLDDSSGAMRHGTATTELFSDFGQMGLGREFTGTEWVTFANAEGLNNLQAMTIEAWVNASSVNSRNHPILLNGNHSWGLKIYSSNRLQWFIYDEGATTYRSAWSNLNAPQDEWVYLVGRYDPDESSNNVSMYVDGVRQNSRATASTVPASEFPIHLAHNSEETDRYFLGILDEVRISSVARPEAWIEAQARSMQDEMIIYSRPESWPE